MNTFPVWVRSLGGASRVTVEGAANTRWLLERLRRATNVNGPVTMLHDKISSICSFQMAYDASTSRSGFEKLLAAIPEVKLMTEPE
jgi:hypothetical protein